MLGSRYLTPYFGSGIGTWSALISVVLVAMMAGYFVGGALADRWPSTALCGTLTVVAAIYMMAVPPGIDALFAYLADFLGEGPAGSITAAAALLFVPLLLISSFLPFAVRLLLTDTAHGGRISGRVYGVSTIGNILGTLMTTFLLMPRIGTRMLTLCLAVAVGMTGLALIILDRRHPRTRGGVKVIS
jgi:predicted membrane-bound spermidine synthase